MATCDENIKMLGGTRCPDATCNDPQVKEYIHAFCTCQPPFQNGCVNPFPNCCAYDVSTPVFVATGTSSGNCYCCCGGVTSDMPIASDATQTKPIDTFQIGDPVYVATDATLATWVEKPVIFSSGTGALGGGNTRIRITFGEGEDMGQLYVNRDHLFLMPNRKLKRTSTLVPGNDQLVRQDGTPVPIIDLTVGKYMKGVHHIATSTQVATNVDGHLILANGIVSGDYALQISNLIPDELMVEGHDQLPEFGTKEYVEAYPKLAAGSVRACATDKSKIPDSDVFQPFGNKPPMRTPAMEADQSPRAPPEK